MPCNEYCFRWTEHSCRGNVSRQNRKFSPGGFNRKYVSFVASSTIRNERNTTGLKKTLIAILSVIVCRRRLIEALCFSRAPHPPAAYLNTGSGCLGGKGRGRCRHAHIATIHHELTQRETRNVRMKGGLAASLLDQKEEREARKIDKLDTRKCISQSQASL